ncbi:hypothetical protein CLV31_1196 [Algoriphagus aquaeductus]|uniref:Uncharacterized protein n=1 Tax=Algoriphagus aquaeductus TaxID=475299 RepID=A0A326RSF0_9BACT|nr:hypothetical protein CLV31_1196 [Algoriphagus aquaeductus]
MAPPVKYALIYESDASTTLSTGDRYFEKLCTSDRRIPDFNLFEKFLMLPKLSGKKRIGRLEKSQLKNRLPQRCIPPAPYSVDHSGQSG